MTPKRLNSLKQIEMLEPVVFYITADDETIWNRLRQRGDNSEEARRRLNTDDKDFQGVDKYIDFAIKNDGSESPEFLARMIVWLYLHKKKYMKMRK